MADPTLGLTTTAATTKTMSSSKPGAEKWKPGQVRRKPRILLAASGSVAAMRFGNLCHCFSESAEVKAVATKDALRFIDRASLPRGIELYTDEDEWQFWRRVGDPVLHIELQRWADIMVIAPLSANTFAKIAGGLCDNLLTCTVRAWDYKKPFFVAPSMNISMWRSPMTDLQLMKMDELGVNMIPPVTTTHPNGESTGGAMAENSHIHATIVMFWHNRTQAAP